MEDNKPLSNDQVRERMYHFYKSLEQFEKAYGVTGLTDVSKK